MTNRTTPALSAAVLSAAALSLAAPPVLAQQTIPYEAGEYEYAQPDPQLDDDVVTETLPEAVTAEKGAARVIPMRRAGTPPVYIRKPVVQPIATTGMTAVEQPAIPGTVGSPAVAAAPGLAATPPAAPVVYASPANPGSVPVLYAYPAPARPAQAPGGAARAIYRDAAPQSAPPEYANGSAYGAAPTYLPAGAQIVSFDRGTWLEECRARLDTYEDDGDRGRAIGALIGAAGGAVIGNRVAGSGNRTAGTLIGGGAGALAGMAVGDALGDGDRGAPDSYGQCQAYLDDYMAEAGASVGRMQYTQPGQYMLIPVTVMVPQRAVYRDGTPAN